MLDYIRSNTQSWGIKIAFGIIIVVFVFWGLGSVQNIGSSSVVAKVNGQSILQHDFLRQYQNIVENYRINNPNVTQEQINNMGIGQQVLQKMIIDTLLQEEARRAGITITPRELFRSIEKIPTFHDEKGKFNKDTYLNILKAQRLSPGRFETDVSKGLLEEKLRYQVTEGAYILPSTISALYDYSREQRIVEYVLFSSSDYMDLVPTEDNIKKYYDANKNLFTIPAKIKLEYIEISAAALGDAVKVTEQEVKDYYAKNELSFTIPEQADVSHILIKLAENADAAAISAAEAKIKAALKELKEKKTFKDVVKKYSEDGMTSNEGGNLGLIKRGDTVAEFDKVAFSLKENEVSDMVRTSFGFHLIKLNKLEKAKLTDFDEVYDKIVSDIKLQAGTDKVQGVVDILVEGNIVGTPLIQLAKENALSAESSDLLSSLEVQEQLNINAEDAELLMQAIVDAPYDVAIQQLDRDFIVAKVLESKPATVEKMEDVKAEIVLALKAELALVAALDKAKEVRKNMGAELPAEYKSKIKATSAIARGQGLPNFDNSQELSAAIFLAETDTWLPSSFQVGGIEDGAVLVRIKAIVPAKGDDLAILEQVLTQSVTTARKNEMFNMLVLTLMEKAEIQIENQDLINRTAF